VRPIDVGLDETFRFVNENLPSGNLRILEVGCGTGELAKRLQDNGREVVAIDSSAETIEKAASLGINARIAVWPDFAEEPFDVILFTRSLHHIRPLSDALERARQLLKPDGHLVVEDFAFSNVHRSVAEWFYLLLKVLDSCGVLLEANDSFGRKLLSGNGAFALWQDHTHEINSAREVFDAANDSFEVLKVRWVPYLYRYVSQMVEDSDRGGAIVARVFDLEKKMGAENEDYFIGRRFVAKQMRR
jgi:SAM-dependent methyltransferase